MDERSEDGLETLVEKLERSYYNVINTLCETAKKQSQKLQELEVLQSASQYISLCNRLINEIQQYIKAKRESFMPYVRKLLEKENAGHDCSKCTGDGCSLQHTAQLMELKEAHAHIKDILYRLQMVSLPLYSDTNYPDVYRVLRNHMALIESNLTGLFSIEETSLIPKIIEAQKNVRARD